MFYSRKHLQFKVAAAAATETVHQTLHNLEYSLP